jgi:hypothetical protein
MYTCPTCNQKVQTLNWFMPVGSHVGRWWKEQHKKAILIEIVVVSHQRDVR